jgi:hypothetical protein
MASRPRCQFAGDPGEFAMRKIVVAEWITLDGRQLPVKDSWIVLSKNIK